jgi:DNA-binding response OmpR family regulator
VGTESSDCAEKKELAMLILYEGDAPDRCWTIGQDEMVVGREPDCEISLPDRQVSRRHAVLRRREGEYVIEDCGSKNGTYVNGRPLDGPYRLHDGDEIQVALRFKLTFVDAGATTPLFLEVETTHTAGVVIDKESRRVWVMGRELDPPLSLAQYHLLELLCDRAGRVCSRDDIIKAVWPDSAEDGISEQAIDALARRLRERLAENNPSHQYIVTVRGHGFRLDNGQ